MIDWPAPTPLFNPIIDPVPLAGRTEFFAGPYAILAYFPLIPLVVLLARRWPRAAIAAAGIGWLALTAQPIAAAILVGGLLLSVAYIELLARGRRSGALSERGMIALVWIGLHALVFPLWWFAHPGWLPSRMAALHAGGFAYCLLRLISWGVDYAKSPGEAMKLGDTLAWLLYSPVVRNGPVLRRADFVERLREWRPVGPRPWARVGYRLALAIGGASLMVVLMSNIPTVNRGATDFFAAPQAYSTSSLLRVFYLVPIQVYLFLWTYNELVAAAALLVGIRVDDNFCWLPLATSVKDFWRRWHITVGAWLREYIYIPLGGNRTFAPLNYAAVFGYCAVWHGASWSFVAWAASQALALSVQRYWEKWFERGERASAYPLPLRIGWTALCWLVTMHYQIATIVIFADFQHMGMRLLPELWRRLVGGG